MQTVFINESDQKPLVLVVDKNSNFSIGEIIVAPLSKFAPDEIIKVEALVRSIHTDYFNAETRRVVTVQIFNRSDENNKSTGTAKLA